MPQVEQVAPADPIAQPRGIAGVVLPVVRRSCPPPDDGEIVVCARVSTEHYRLRPLPVLRSEPNVLYKPYVIKIGPFRAGLLGNGAGVGVTAKF